MNKINRNPATPLILLLVFICTCMSTCLYYDSKHPYALGSHWNYEIICENGVKYKVLDQHRGVIPLLKRNGENMSCLEEYK